MSGRAARFLVLSAALVAGSRSAKATGGTYLGESSRVAALANAAAARPGDVGTLAVNPAGLGDVDEPQVVLNASLARLESHFARHGEPEQDRGRWIAGYGLAAGTPLPGAWLERIRVGIALFLPAEHVLDVGVPERPDEPSSPIYDGRPEHIAATAGVAVEVLPELRVGAGVTLAPFLDTPTDVSFEAGRGDEPEDDVVVRLERDLRLGFAPLAGIRAEPLDGLALAVVYRSAVDVSARGKNRTVAGGILADDPIDYGQFWQPDQLAWGVALSPLERWSASLDATWSRWSQFRSAGNDRVRPAFDNVVSLACGLEWQATKAVALRGGYAFEPTPVPPQTGATNYLGADTHVVGAGAGVDLRRLWRAPLRVDAHLRSHLGGTQRVDKRVTELPDADADAPGHQVDNLGYPGFESRALLFQAGLTLTLFVGKEQP